ncbi:hypothetical protein AB6809_29460 [Paraburkholderia sp. RCC_158]|uniref:hypothetical protein n=1 Tax=Paraburkholderia sp. RCC_158 TaxID=3239220 RepID=UPI00352624E1
MQIKHPNVVPCQGYGYGAVQNPTDTYLDSSIGNRYAYLGDRVFDVHPYRDDVMGYPIRWELDTRQKQKLAGDRAFWKEMGVE